MHRLAVYLTNCFLEYGIADKDSEEEYTYGMEVALGKALNYTTLLILAILNKVLFPSLIYFLVFFSLRGRTGGYHAKSPVTCYVGTIFIYITLIYGVSPLLKNNLVISLCIILFSWVVIIVFAPVNHPNLCLNAQEVRDCKRASRWILILVTAGICLLTAFQINKDYAVYALAGMGIDAILLCTAKLIGQEVNEG